VVSAQVFIEGAGSKEQQIRCREAFRKLLEKSGLTGKLRRLSACGSRNQAFEDFRLAHGKRKGDEYVALLVDSEDPVADIEKPWEHLRQRDGWTRPDGAVDEQAMLMTTGMETWIVADRPALREHYGAQLQESALPPLQDLEQRDRHDVQERLAHATRDCKNAYAKGKRSFDALAAVGPRALATLPSFGRAIRILKEKIH
jgi:hypothetical protein